MCIRDSATGQDPIDLAEVMKKGVEEDRVLIMPFHDEKKSVDWINSEYDKVRLYMLPENCLLYTSRCV